VTARIAPQLRALIVPLDSVTLHPRNPRQGDVPAVAESLRRFGQLKTVVVQASTRYVVAGNHLVRAARSLGWTEIAANVEELDDAEATAFMLADNRTSDLGGYDDALLAAILAEQEAADNLAATGYDDDDVAALLRAAGIEASHGDPDAAPDRPADADVYVRPGELWALGRHRLLVDDSTDPAAVERVTAGARALVGTALRLAPLRPGGAFYVAAPAGPAHLVFLLALADASLPVHQTLIWAKDRFVLGHSDYHYRHEPVLYGWRDGAAHHFIDDRTQDSVWEIPRPTRSEAHPTMKPVELVERAIRNSSRPGDTVYDGFVGSGTTLIAAEKSMRACRALEIDPTYAQVAIERWQTFAGKTAERLS
jgi:site-specific DNA-methyltransferase (adenine-specific)